MEINNAQELKALMITEVLEYYAEKTGKALEFLADLLETSSEFRDLIMGEVEFIALKLL
ncbi:hypothetical protein [Lonepinella koalarum]|uniref:Uncharacterized protein n=1 Tax=Lonepinella koalarum TaxID=53417 RepID=A0A4R1KXK1_9PAST|nr:hypothetical protein [Lonepinella koalarum]TCK70132.1 hypothetical protein EV692_1358 [Lonepinella koalarum]